MSASWCDDCVVVVAIAVRLHETCRWGVYRYRSRLVGRYDSAQENSKLSFCYHRFLNLAYPVTDLSFCIVYWELSFILILLL